MLHTRNCLVCGVEFTQPGIRGTLRRMCSEACSLRRIRERKKQRTTARYRMVRDAGGSLEMAVWASQGRIRTEAMLSVLKEEK